MYPDIPSPSVDPMLRPARSLPVACEASTGEHGVRPSTPGRPYLRAFIALGVLLLGFGGSSHALDRSAEGTYAVVHRDGHTTGMLFRSVRGAARWRIESRQRDGRWRDVTCQAGCELRDTEAAQAARWIAESGLQGSGQCVHDEAFAFCLVDRRPYVLARVTGRAIAMKLQRVDPVTFAPVPTP